MSIAAQRLDGIEYAVVSLESTGLLPGRDRVVELSVALVRPGAGARLELTSVIDPQRPIGGTSVHGLRAEDLVDAPTFASLAPTIGSLLSGRVIVAHNAQHELRFFVDELSRVGLRRELPHLCTMYLRCMLGGERLSLSDACHVERVEVGSGPGAKAFAAAQLLGKYLDKLRRAKLSTFAELAKGHDYVFLRSLASWPVQPGELGTTASASPKPRPSGLGGQGTIARYQDAVLAVLADLDVTEAEIDSLLHLRGELGLADETVRAVHARTFALMIELVAGDEHLDEGERGQLYRIRQGLQRLGWAPGD